MSACKNCGAKGFNLDRKDYECANCGYRNVETKELSPSTLVFCETCGNHYLSPPGCPTHSEDKQRPVKW